MAINPKSLANLKKIKKGQALNPSGKRKDGSVPQRCEAEFRAFLRDTVKPQGSKESKERLAWLMERLFTSAMKGDNQAAALLLDRAYGKAIQNMDGINQGNVTIQVITGVPKPDPKLIEASIAAPQLPAQSRHKETQEDESVDPYIDE